ncbi:hypothetical protein OO013_15755 [Mangrovivirga sp. M17]|uniref:DUF3108 domain-containing protein n=1 Tax=Mangrovivirga halotolerans TaxID=2993936 RepID=A0ABT3RVF7_9BACT|nr:hypothetical protein [Mangrovivirga halotolerans]MCX2745333.1 hypothetical protein [Mangrovivirga halotolerans]
MKYLQLIFFFTFTISAFSQNADSIKVGQPFKDFDELHYEPYDFEVYMVRDGKKTPSMPMKSTTKKVIINGKEYVEISHAFSLPSMQGGFTALVEAETFKPVIQIRNSRKGKEAYRFLDNQVIGLDSAKQNTAADYKTDLNEPMFNFELDLETYSILPFEDGKELYIPFFHAGGQANPGWYKYTVTSAKIDVEGLGSVDAWVLFTDYKGTQPTKFWYTKKGREFVKMEGTYQGMKIYKVRKF